MLARAGVSRPRQHDRAGDDQYHPESDTPVEVLAPRAPKYPQQGKTDTRTEVEQSRQQPWAHRTQQKLGGRSASPEQKGRPSAAKTPGFRQAIMSDFSAE
jgi:hypothetical protein